LKREVENSLTMNPSAGISPFGPISGEYDDVFTHSAIGRAQRALVWLETDREFRSGQRILEINCGTGFDAEHLSARGINVVACDSSPEMIALARTRLQGSSSEGQMEFHALPTELISRLRSKGQFDGFLSNFAGLNCVADLARVAGDLAGLVRPGGRAILCVFGRSCLWEMAWYGFRGELRKAFRRRARNGVQANLGRGARVRVYYPSIRSIRHSFTPHFRLLRSKGIGVTVPPSYLEQWAHRFPRLFRFAAWLDPFLGKCPCVRALADHVVLVLERVGA
jgi:SAM-dependent methyltransferase